MMDEDALWAHEMQEPEQSMYDDLEATYHMLDELKHTIIEVAGDFDLAEEIDRTNCKSLIDDIAAIERVRDLLLTEMDPR